MQEDSRSTIEMFCRENPSTQSRLVGIGCHPLSYHPERAVAALCFPAGLRRDTAARSLAALRDEHGILSVEDLRTHPKLTKTVVEILEKYGMPPGTTGEQSDQFI
ncbi:hypothetical protein [Paradesulfitobacterium ferrireducens]|uniref:hypothetical protein n=1 Tax=Paradesulfitobacterium ferrireducens TaxID=2816476 RepID=UPI001A8CD249|nr:hypothetical protein [Paradesulfitobacterium ferrireducens]